MYGELQKMVRRQIYNGTNVLSADYFQTLKAHKKDETLCYCALQDMHFTRTSSLVLHAISRLFLDF